MTIEAIRIGDCVVGPGAPVFVVAEAGINHNGDIELAKELIDAGAEAGADAIKFQSFRAERLASAKAPKAAYQLRTTDPREFQLEMLCPLELSSEAQGELQAHCRDRGVLFLSSPFDEESIEWLNDLNVPAFKIGSGEITNWPLLASVGRRSKPVILSTGMSCLSEVTEAVGILREAGCRQLVLLQCVSSYPADAADANLRAIRTLQEAFHVPVGFSDHTLGFEVALAAVALGACVIEKHLTLDKTLPGPDHPVSLEPEELTALVRGIRIVEAAMGNGVKQPAASEANVQATARRSIVAQAAIPAGTLLTPEMLAFKRPGSGIPPSKVALVVGRKTTRMLPADAMITDEDLA
jgi:N,N'-diacetyllegionaminate synthase